MSLTSFIQQNQVLPLKKISYHFKWHFWGGQIPRSVNPVNPTTIQIGFGQVTLPISWPPPPWFCDGDGNLWRKTGVKCVEVPWKNPVSFHHLLYISHVWRLWRFHRSSMDWRDSQPSDLDIHHGLVTPHIKFQGVNEANLKQFSRTKCTAFLIFTSNTGEFDRNWGTSKSPNGNGGSLAGNWVLTTSISKHTQIDIMWS